MRRDAKRLKEIFLTTLSITHPTAPTKIRPLQKRRCVKFLRNFLKGDDSGNVYTMNYDLLLYWVLVGNFKDSIGDGFGESSSENITWLGRGASLPQRAHFLHGALHLFDTGSEVGKLTWRNDNPLVDQVRENIDVGEFPLFVSEGESSQKLIKIRRNPYLRNSYRDFAQSMNQKNNALFIFGHRISDTDRHILDKIARGHIEKLYVSIHAGSDEDEKTKTISNALKIGDVRHSKRHPLRVQFYDADSAKVWDKI